MTHVCGEGYLCETGQCSNAQPRAASVIPKGVSDEDRAVCSCGHIRWQHAHTTGACSVCAACQGFTVRPAPPGCNCSGYGCDWCTGMAPGVASSKVLTCTCGSGGHPRECAAHPLARELHCAELSLANVTEERDELAAEVERLRTPTQPDRDDLEAEVISLRADLDEQAAELARLRTGSAIAGDAMVTAVDLDGCTVRLYFDGHEDRDMREWAALLGKTVSVTAGPCASSDAADEEVAKSLAGLETRPMAGPNASVAPDVSAPSSIPHTEDCNVCMTTDYPSNDVYHVCRGHWRALTKAVMR